MNVPALVELSMPGRFLTIFCVVAAALAVAHAQQPPTFGTTTRSLENWRKQAALQGPLSLLERKERDTPPTAPILDGDKEARLTKIACSTAPNGRSRWTLQMLADELVALEVVESISADTVGRVQKKRNEAVA